MTDSEDKTQINFMKVAQNAAQGFQAIRLFITRVAPLSDQQDFDARMKFLSTVLQSLQILIPDLMSVQADPNQPKNYEFSKDEVKILTDAVKNDPRTQLQMAEAYFAIQFRDAPVQGQLTRQGALIVLVSTFELAIANVIQAYYERFPKALGDDRKITLADLRAVGSIAEAEHRLIEEEVDSVLRDNTINQLTYLRQRLKIPLATLEDLHSSLVEISLRRNLFVHNGGIVNRYYMRQVDPVLAQIFGAVEGTKIDLSTDYLVASINTMDVAATVIIQAAWRKFVPQESVLADVVLVQTTYEALREQDYGYVEKFSGLALAMKFHSADAVVRLMTINHAIALRATNQLEQMNKVIDGLDWSAAALPFVLALHVLRNEQSKFLDVLPKAIASGDVDFEQLTEAPLYHIWRGQPWFEEAIERFRPQAN